MTYVFRSILNSTLTEAVVALNVPLGVTLLQTYPPKRNTRERPVVENGEVLVKLSQVPPRATNTIRLRFWASSATTGTVSFPCTVTINQNSGQRHGA